MSIPVRSVRLLFEVHERSSWDRLGRLWSEAMKFICLGYLNESKWNRLSETEQSAMIEECFAYDDELRRGGHFVGGEALQPARNGVTLHFEAGRVVVTDGPFAETKEQLGGILVLEARDLNQAIQLMSRHPGVRHGSFEIRPADEQINAMIAARALQCQAQTVV